MSKKPEAVIEDLEGLKEPVYLDLADVTTEMLPYHMVKKKPEKKEEPKKPPAPPAQRTRTIKPQGNLT